ncbi:hypothetical protein FLAG1_05192 [Fusarium langsethiae]|uniref:Altered inheritance of mitochondria protein 11 n=1 Tax=Fusarium langsethiae TaxID=179993 RepID=A0A0M9EXU7_FUSLA|nr:hypothetical protein FLAG1_05192 [Fusarium langsethiae]GKU00082.1 unnamed protein product [Fusarium langsethiae]GKU18480.1 unnamed protein product [Fusarium langsethiae]
MPILASLVSSWLGVPAASDNKPTPQQTQEATTPSRQTSPKTGSIITAIPTPQSTTATPSSTISAHPQSTWERSLRQMGLLLTGAGFLAASVAVSRRSVLRMRRDSLPKFYSSNQNPVKVDMGERSFLAAQALGLATLNVMSFGVMLVGGISWAFDLASVAELRERTQAAVRRPGSVDPEDEKAMEELMEDLMGKLGMDKPQKPSDAQEENEN